MTQADPIDRLVALLPEPAQPVETPGAGDWSPLEARIHFRLPSDFKTLLERYGSGIVDGFLWALNPFSPDENRRFPEASERQLGILRSIREQGIDLPYPVYPEASGLVLWAETANGDCLYWRTLTDQPDDWPVCVNEARGSAWVDHPGPATAALADLLEGVLDVDFFPSNFPLPSHSFSAFD